MKAIYFDTETTGKPEAYTAHPRHWPRLVQIAWIVTNSDGRIFERASFMIKPEGFLIPEQSTEIHGITHERAMAEGHDLKEVMTMFGKAWRSVPTMVCHNVHFDLNIVEGEAFRLWDRLVFSGKPHICTMKQTTKIVKAPNKNKAGYKWPNLDELCQFCGVTNTKAHDALGDVLATYECHQFLINNGYELHPQTVEK